MVCVLLCALRSVCCVPFYLYQGPAFDWLGNCSSEWGNELNALRKDQYGGELHFLEQVAHSPERVAQADASRAQVFVVPALLTFGAPSVCRARVWHPDPAQRT